MMSLGRGFYEFFFASEMDMRSVWAAGIVSLKPGVLSLFEWSKDFNMHMHREIGWNRHSGRLQVRWALLF